MLLCRRLLFYVRRIQVLVYQKHLLSTRRPCQHMHYPSFLLCRGLCPIISIDHSNTCTIQQWYNAIEFQKCYFTIVYCAMSVIYSPCVSKAPSISPSTLSRHALSNNATMLSSIAQLCYYAVVHYTIQQCCLLCHVRHMQAHKCKRLLMSAHRPRQDT